MNGPQHYQEAERLLAEHPADDEVATRRAQVHATLALAAATAHPAIVDWIGPDARQDARLWTLATKRTEQ